MTASQATDEAELARRVPGRLGRWGPTGWRIVGILLAAVLGYVALVAFSGLLVPLLLAVVIGVLGVPAVDWLRRYRVPRPVGALLFILALIAVGIGSIVLIVRGVIDEGPKIQTTLAEAMTSVDDWLSDTALVSDPNSVAAQAGDQGAQLLTGAASWITTVFSSVTAFAVGTFLALFIVYYILVDWVTVRTWVSAHLGVPPDVGGAIIDDGSEVVRRGFGAMTLTSVIVAGVIGLAMALMGIPLAGTVVVVTFVTAYIPYIGAIVAGAFGFLVALGAAGIHEAIILLIVILVAQNVIQTLVGNRLTSDKLEVHPLPNMLATVVGAALFGFLGAMFAGAALALWKVVARRLRAAGSPVDADTGPADDVVPDARPAPGV